MKSTGTKYDYVAGYSRMKSYLDSSDNNYEESDSLPSRDSLTFSNGYYAYCSAMFVDIRKSSDLPNKYKRPALAKLYRAFISEVVAVLDGCDLCQEVNIVGDGVWGVFNTPYKTDINDTFSRAAMVASVLKFLNYQLEKHGYDPINVGIGLSYGRALVIKAGFSGSGINDIVYMGDVVNHSAKLAAHGMEAWNDKQLMVSSVFYDNLNDHNKGLLSYNYTRSAYHGSVINTAMDEWYVENCT
jgi:class 3 adenylate cyclase